MKPENIFKNVRKRVTCSFLHLLQCFCVEPVLVQQAFKKLVHYIDYFHSTHFGIRTLKVTAFHGGEIVPGFWCYACWLTGMSYWENY